MSSAVPKDVSRLVELVWAEAHIEASSILHNDLKHIKMQKASKVKVTYCDQG